MLSCIVDRNKFSRNRMAILVIERSRASLRRIATEMLARRSLWVTLMFKLSQNIRHHMISDYLTRCAYATYIFHFCSYLAFFLYASLLTVLCASMDSNKDLPVASTAMMCSISMTSPSLSAEAELENQVLLAQTLKMHRRCLALDLYLTICLTGFCRVCERWNSSNKSHREVTLFVWIQY